VDSSNVLTILSFNALKNCLGFEVRVVFSGGSRCYLSIDRGQFSKFIFFIYNEITSLHLKAKKIGLLSRGFYVVFILFAKLKDDDTLKS